MAGKIFNDNGLKQGRLLAQGHGDYDMMDKCFKNNWNDSNTILVVEDTDDMNSKWRIYEGVKNVQGKI